MSDNDESPMARSHRFQAEVAYWHDRVNECAAADDWCGQRRALLEMVRSLIEFQRMRVACNRVAVRSHDSNRPGDVAFGREMANYREDALASVAAYQQYAEQLEALREGEPFPPPPGPDDFPPSDDWLDDLT